MRRLLHHGIDKLEAQGNLARGRVADLAGVPQPDAARPLGAHGPQDLHGELHVRRVGLCECVRVRASVESSSVECSALTYVTPGSVAVQQGRRLLHVRQLWRYGWLGFGRQDDAARCALRR